MKFQCLQQQLKSWGLKPWHVPPFLKPLSMQDLLHVAGLVHFSEQVNPGGPTGPKHVAKPTTKLKLKK